MTVESIINKTGKDLSPYMGSLVNHLPMAQWALYKLSDDAEIVDLFTKSYFDKSNIDRVEEKYREIKSLEEALGKRELYEGTLDFLKKEILDKDIEELTREILNKYPLGMSSGLFHTLIRVAYAVEGYMEKEMLKEELLKALSYYVTAYRKADLFEREVSLRNIISEMEDLAGDIHIKKILEEHDTLGQRIKALYNDKLYMEKAFIIKGKNHEKIKTLLSLLIPLFCKSGNIVILHCITGIHALVMLKDFYKDFGQAIDTLTTCIITHLIATGITEYPVMGETKTGLSWYCIKQKSLRSSDVHDVKLTYSALFLDKIYNVEQLKDVVVKRVRHE